jgi:uncharacterized protein YjlB
MRLSKAASGQVGGVLAYHHFDARGHCILVTDARDNLMELDRSVGENAPMTETIEPAGSGVSLPAGFQDRDSAALPLQRCFHTTVT